MLERIRFYFQHSYNDLLVNGRLTIFALLSIAAGVAAIVSLQTLAVMIGDTLTGNLQTTNRGDIRIQLLDFDDGPPFASDDEQEATESAEDSAEPAPAADADGAFEAARAQAAADGILIAPSGDGGAFSSDSYFLSEDGLAVLSDWLESNFPGEVDLTHELVMSEFFEIISGSGDGASVINPETGAEASQTTPRIIDPALYPFYDEVRSLDGTPLAELISEPTDIVLDEAVAELVEVGVGDRVHLNGTDTDFIVRGLVPTESEVTDPFTGIFAALFGFYYVDHAAVQFFDVEPQADTVYLRLEDPARVDEINRALLNAFPYLETQTTTELEQQNAETADTLNQLVTIMGLISLLIGSIGILNTMQVIVRRRTLEIAVLKTIGLQANQITVLFLVEAFIMGLVGSVVGIVLGWVTTFFIKSVAETVVAQPIAFRIALSPALNGLFVGTLIATIFGFLPTLTAGQVRPGVVLRPSDAVLPRAGFVRSLLTIIFTVLALSLVAQTILGSFTTALAVTAGAFIAAGVIYVLLMLLIWLFGRFFPAFGSVDLKVSLRQMLASRRRSAVTLLALVVGVFSLSLITMFAESITGLLSIALGGDDGNVIIATPAQASQDQIVGTLDALDAVEQYQTRGNYQVTLVTLEEGDTGEVLTFDELVERVRNAEIPSFQAAAAFGANPDDFDIAEILEQRYGSVDTRPLDSLPDKSFLSGRQLDSDDLDAELPKIILTDNEILTAAGFDVGDRLTYEVGQGALSLTGIVCGFGGENTTILGDLCGGATVTFEIVGIAEAAQFSGALADSDIYTFREYFPENRPPDSFQTLALVQEDRLNEVRRELADVPQTFIFETELFNRLLASLLGTFTAFPTMVALLGLIVGGVVIANSVALTTMERRREIAVMKAVGLQRERVLLMLLLENALLGFIGGLIGVGIGLVALVVLLSQSGAVEAIPYGTALILMLVCISVALTAAVTTAWGAAGEKPLNVLRYE